METVTPWISSTRMRPPRMRPPPLTLPPLPPLTLPFLSAFAFGPLWRT